MFKKGFIITIYLLGFSLPYYTQAKTSLNNDPAQETSIPFNDKENLLISRIDTASLNGNSSLMLDYYTSLMKSFMSEDKQMSIITFSLDFLSKIIVYQNYTFAQNLLDHLVYRINYLSRATEEQKKEWLHRVEWYKATIAVLIKDDLKDYKIPSQLTQNLRDEDEKPSLDLLLQKLTLGLCEVGYTESKFQHLYLALNTANMMHNTQMYYFISTILIKLYIKTKQYDSAITRLNLMYQLFSNIQPSDYYRIKVLIYFTQTFLIKGDAKQALSSYLRAKEMLLYNQIISSDEVKRLQDLLSQLNEDMQKYMKDKNIIHRNFLDQLIINENNTN
jgi:hypothetical protein